uniref:Uncharacterized protein n=1 Tax=Romanomermis culicivorax TaxID=13658 RepID=A0A915JML9_ROMCU
MLILHGKTGFVDRKARNFFFEKWIKWAKLLNAANYWTDDERKARLHSSSSASAPFLHISSIERCCKACTCKEKCK